MGLVVFYAMINWMPVLFGNKAVTAEALVVDRPTSLLGAAFGGFLAAWIIPQFGWRSVLVFGGLVPLVVAALIFGLMPESVRYMVANGASADRIRGVLRRISPSANGATSFVAREAKVSKATGGLGIVFSQTYVVAGWVMDRLNGNVTVAICFGLTAVALWAIGRSGGNIAALTVLVVVAGVLLNTAQTSLPFIGCSLLSYQGPGDWHRLDDGPWSESHKTWC
jgi:MFS transporter, AAHS family, 4-hydroxybenzoate transporter